jgi:uncharacterized protein (DUF885 family)
MRITLFAAAGAALSLSAVPALADDAEDFAQLVADYEAYQAEGDLGRRAREGDLEAAASWPDISAERAAESAEATQGFYDRLQAIDMDGLRGQDRVSYAVLNYLLQFTVERVNFQEQRTPFVADSGFFTTPTYAAASTRPRTIEEAEAWIERVRHIDDYFDANVDWMRQGLEAGFTQPRTTAENVVVQLERLNSEEALQTAFARPLSALPPAAASDEERARLEADLAEAVSGDALPAYEALHAFFTEEYIPGTRESIGISEVPEGREYYQMLVRYHTTLETTPEEVHERGLAEVARIRAEMEEVIAESGFEGSFAEFLNFLRADPQFYAESEQELLMYAAWISKRADDAMPRFFRNLPRLPYGVRAVPASMAPTYTTGRYWPGDLENGVAGGYMVNTYDLSQRPLYTLPALTVHEGVPGHHHQIALAQEIEDVPQFRRQSYITAFGEGWGLYTETLAEDMGLYTTPYERFGKLTYEMWRACRLVVDTGMHYFGWTQEEAEACLLENSALAPHNVRTEVQRYISWPGQALAYKTGELLMRDLRAEAEAVLQEDFDIRDFHDTLLSDGAMPLSALEEKMRGWIADEDLARQAN